MQNINLQNYAFIAAEKRALEIFHKETKAEESKEYLSKQLNHNSVYFNTALKTESNLMKIDRDVFKKTPEERELLKRLKSEYKKG